MRSTDELWEFYQAELEPICASIAEIRQLQRQTFLQKLTWALLLSAAALAGWGAWGRSVPDWGTAILIGIPAIAWSMVFSAWRQDEVWIQGRFKLDVIYRLVKFFEPELEYFPEQTLSEELFRASGLARESYNRYEGEDLICGKCCGVDFSLAEVKALKVRTYLDRHARPRQIEEPIFDGVVIVADFHKHFAAETVVVAGGPKGVLSSLASGALYDCPGVTRGEVVTMEDAEFERIFTVYSEDPVEARYLITPVMQEQMVLLARRFEGELSFVFRYERLFIGLRTTRNFFELGDGTTLDFFTIQRTATELNAFLRIVEDLRLNVRIWSKE